MTRNQTERPRRRVPLWLAAGVVTVGLVLVVIAVLAQRSAPQAPRSVGRIDPPAGSSPSPGASSDAAPTPASTGATPLPPSRPVKVSIPSIGVSSRLLSLGLADDGTLQVPQPGPNENRAAWFNHSPTPGQPGPAIIEGHVDTTSGPSVFFDLGKLRPGDKISVTRADGIVVVFTVNAVRDFPKSRFPTEVVYGGKDLSRPQLRLITCSDFDTATGHHTGNAVVFAHLTGSHRA